MAAEDEATGGAPEADSDSAALAADLFIQRLASDVRASLSESQLQDVRRVAAAIAPRDHPVDWRFSLPGWFGGRRFYGVLLAGADNRGPQRRTQDRVIRRQRRRSRLARFQALAVGVAVLALILMIAAGIVHAEEAKSGLVGIEGVDDRTPIETEAWPWSALGRINREVGGHCTGALIAPDLVLTAAHCLYNFKDRRWTIPMEVHFVAGFRRGAYREHAIGRHFDVSPRWDPASAKTEANIGNDWALVELDRSFNIQPVRLSTLSFADMKRAAAEGELTIAGYNGDFAEILTQHHGCDLLGKGEGGRILLHDCDATFGSSGAPLLLVTPAGAEIIGLQSAVVEMDDGRVFGAAVPVEAFRKAASDY